MSNVIWIVGLLIAAAWAMFRGEAKPGATSAEPTLGDGLPTLGSSSNSAATSSNLPAAVMPAKATNTRAAAYETLLDLLDELRARGVSDADVDKLGEQIAPLLLKRKAVTT